MSGASSLLTPRRQATEWVETLESRPRASARHRESPACIGQRAHPMLPTRAVVTSYRAAALSVQLSREMSKVDVRSYPADAIPEHADPLDFSFHRIARAQEL